MKINSRTMLVDCAVLSFLVLSIFFVTFSFPRGDEPDYGYRVLHFSEWVGSNYYRVLNFEEVCHLRFESMSLPLWFLQHRCLPDYQYGLMKIFSGVALFSFTYFIFILFGLRTSYRLEISSFSVPGVWLAVFAAGAESIATTISLFLISQRPSLRSLLMLYLIMFFDFGLAFLFLSFYLFSLLMQLIFARVRFALPYLLFAVALIISDAFSFAVEGFISFLPGHVHDVYIVIRELDVFFKYSTMERFVSVFIMSGGWFPSHLKLIAPVFLMSCFFLIVFISAFFDCVRMRRGAPADAVMVVSAVIFVFLIVSFFPNYSNFKYYVFLVPIFIRYAFVIFGKWFYLTFSSLLSIGAILSSLLTVRIIF